MGRKLRVQKKIDYAKVNRKYDGFSFKSHRTAGAKPKANPGIPGRARSAPPITTWPYPTMHHDVDYYDDIDTDAAWATTLPDDVKLPFANLSLGVAHKWQGLEQQVAMNGDVEARAHFDAVTTALRIGRSNPAITEAVGEAATAIAMLVAGGWTMIWGFHRHAGTGIDQIWRRPAAGVATDYLIVEAKGPGAVLLFNPFIPTGYNQMDLGWVINHLYSMDRNGHAAGVEIVARMRLAFGTAHANYGGATKSYFGLSAASRHIGSGCTLSGVVVTAVWQADGRLGAVTTPAVRYL